MTKRIVLALVLFVAVLSFMPAAHAQQKGTVLRAVVVQTDQLATYLQEIEKGKALMKKVGVTPNIRVWQARFAGPNAGNVVVAVEFESMAAFAAADQKLTGSTEYMDWIKSLEKIRKVISDSLYSEL